MTNEAKVPNLREFIKHLNSTLKFFDGNIKDEDFEDPNSEVYKLFSNFISLYMSTHQNVDKVSAKNVNSSNTNKNNPEIDKRPKWENPIKKNISKNNYSKNTTRIIDNTPKYNDVTKINNDISQTIGGPIMFSNNSKNLATSDLFRKSDNFDDVRKYGIVTNNIDHVTKYVYPKGDIPVYYSDNTENDIFTTNDITDTKPINQTDKHKIERTEDIDQKINAIKRMFDRIKS